MPQAIAAETLYYTADRSRLVPEDSPDAAFLFVRAGSPFDPAEAQRLGYTGQAEFSADYDAKGDHAAKHGGETQAQATAARAALFDTNARQGQDPDGPPAPGERGNLEPPADAAPAEPVATDEPSLEDEKSAEDAPATKAVTKPPANKSK